MRSSGLTKGRERHGLHKQEVIMKLITRFKLAAKNVSELRLLHKEVFNRLVRSDPLTMERTNAMASLENIKRGIGFRDFSN